MLLSLLHRSRDVNFINWRQKEIFPPGEKFLCSSFICTTISKILRGLRRKSESSFLFLRKLHFLGCRGSELILTQKKSNTHIDRTSYPFFRVPLCLRVSVVQFLTFCPSVYSVPLYCYSLKFSRHAKEFQSCLPNSDQSLSVICGEIQESA